MREEREARERAEQEAKDTAAAADAKKRSETGNFISGQDLREARMVDEYKRQQAESSASAGGAGGAGQEGGIDIRQKVRDMQVSILILSRLLRPRGAPDAFVIAYR